MKRISIAATVLVVIAAAGCSLIHSRAKEEPGEPFYRKYLVAGNPLDERILEQERLVEAEPDSADLRNDFGNLLDHADDGGAVDAESVVAHQRLARQLQQDSLVRRLGFGHE